MYITSNLHRLRRGERGVQVTKLLPSRPLCIALVIALIGTNISLGVKAADGGMRPAGDAAYATPEAAFAAIFVTSGLGERAYQENREYAAAIYEMPDGLWYSTDVIAGSRLESAIPYHAVPPEALRIVGAHTHGQPRIPEDAWHLYGVDFSQADLRNAIYNYRTTHGRIAVQFLLSSELKILRLTLGGEAAMMPGVAFFRPSQEARLTPATIHGTTDLLGQLPLPDGTTTHGGPIRAPIAAPEPEEMSIALGAVLAGRGPDPGRN